MQILARPQNYFGMTLCIGWIRQLPKSEEICIAADSMFTGGGSRLPVAPKLFPLQRGDCAIACAGNTGYTMPLVEHINHAIEINGPIKDRAYDFHHFVHLVEDVVNSCMAREREEQINEQAGPDFSMILAGYSWVDKKSKLYTITFDKRTEKMKASSATTIMGSPVAVIGDYYLLPKVRRKIYKAFEEAGIKRGDAFGYEPLDVLTEYINDGSIDSVGGHLQMLKIYPFMKVMPIGFFYPEEKRIYYYGRPLLKYETFPYPIFDVAEHVFKYMKVNSDKFELVHEETQKLKKFKKMVMREE